MLEEIDRHAAARRNFAFETTLAGHTYATRITKWRGFKVKPSFWRFGHLTKPSHALPCECDKVDMEWRRK